MRVLVVAAHADDETLGVGATLAKHARLQDECCVVLLTDMPTARVGGPFTLQVDRIQAAMTHLGVARVERLQLPDQHLDTVGVLVVAQALEALVQAWRPTVVYGHTAADLNQDHVVAARATAIACRPLAAPFMQALYMFDTGEGSPAWERAADHHYVVLQAADVAAELAALQCYSSELRLAPHPRALDLLRLRPQLTGARIGVAYAQAFQIGYVIA